MTNGEFVNVLSCALYGILDGVESEEVRDLLKELIRTIDDYTQNVAYSERKMTNS